MQMFDVDDNLMVNLENIDFVRIQKVKGKKAVVAGINGNKIEIPFNRHKDFFNTLTGMGVPVTKQFVSL